MYIAILLVKLEQYRENLHGLCARMTYKTVKRFAYCFPTKAGVKVIGIHTGGSFLIQQFIYGCKPNTPGSKYTIPHRETVAGEATARSATSNIIVIVSRNFIISPLLRHNFLLSSSTVFMFSIQTASTGPSKTYHLLSLSGALTPRRTSDGRIPSVL